MTAQIHSSSYDAIVVGARCAGSPTAMLLARRGYRVLVLDRAQFPSDTVSTHLIHPPGVAALDRWGLLGRLIASGCPPIGTYAFDFGPLAISGRPHPAGQIATAYCPRRTVLDALLIAAAGEARAEIREGCTVDELVVEDGVVVGVRAHTRTGTTLVERARVVLGADGAHSRVAAAVGAQRYREKPAFAVAYYSYWRGYPVEAATWAVRPRRGFGAFPTHDDLTMLLAAWPREQMPTVRRDLEGNYLRAVRAAFGEQVAAATREERIFGAVTGNCFRKPYGPGWALVGDAGYLKDPVTAQGITDAFLDAERCSLALDEAFTGTRPFEDAMAEYQRDRDVRALPIYELTAQLASLEPPPPRLQQLLAATAGNPDAMNRFASVIAGTCAPEALSVE
jgi:2-polyprenyl-6-methoxyphenol hydroxylase-like FAD-dependent oxidoreductase